MSMEGIKPPGIFSSRKARISNEGVVVLVDRDGRIRTKVRAIGIINNPALQHVAAGIDLPPLDCAAIRRIGWRAAGIKNRMRGPQSSVAIDHVSDAGVAHVDAGGSTELGREISCPVFIPGDRRGRKGDSTERRRAYGSVNGP